MGIYLPTFLNWHLLYLLLIHFFLIRFYIFILLMLSKMSLNELMKSN